MRPVKRRPARGRQVHEAALNAISELVSVVGEDGTYRMVNDAWCRIVGLQRADVIGRRAAEIFPRIAPERADTGARCLRTGRPTAVRGAMPGATAPGRVFETTYYPRRADENGERSIVIVSRDVTEVEEKTRALRASATDLRRTLDVTGDAIFASDANDPDQPVRFINDRMLQMWGIPPVLAESLTPRQITDAARPLLTDPDAEIARLHEIMAGNRSHEDLLWLRDGRTLLRRCIAAVQDGRNLRIWSMRDITAETRAMQRLRDEEAESRALLEAFPGLIAVLDHELRYVFVNEALAARIGKPVARIVGQVVEDVIDPQWSAALRTHAARSLVEGARTYERQYAEGTVQVTVSGRIDLRTGRPRYYVFGIDITDMKRAEAALVAARDEAQRANQAKSQFVSHMSHELRTPLNAILGFAQLLADDAAPAPGGQPRDAAREILRGGRHLLSLINDVLDLGRIEAGKFTADRLPMPLEPVVHDCLRLVEPLARQRKVTLLPPDDASFDRIVIGDEVRLRQVLLNLLGNAIKYNRPGGTVELTCAQRPAVLRLTVRDTGSGLTSAQLARLFEPFERLHGGETPVEGTGIGLALSRHLMMAMGGDIGARSKAGAGSEFWIELPRPRRRVPRAAPAAPPVAPLAGEAISSPRQVLYIEDNPVNVVLMEAMLARMPGMRMVSETHPVNGLERAFQSPPDLILLDIQLPGMNGFEVLQRLRADARTQGVPVIAVSANAMPEDVNAGLQAGFIAYLTKPVEMDVLARAVQGVLAADGSAE